MASTLTWEAAKARLRKLRDEQRRSSEEIVSLWEDVLCSYSYKLGDELWPIHEQVCVAALDCGRMDIAVMCIQALKAQFPSSLRVKQLEGLAHEAQENYDRALRIYDVILGQDENNSMVRKRKIAIMKSQDKIQDAIKELNKYLEKFMSDYEAWMELCDLYLQEQDYTKAGFCLEELLMSNPHSHLYHQKYAEIKYTQGGVDNMITARRYFAQALKLNPGSVRAMFGMFLAASHVASSKSKDAKTKKDNIKYAAWAAEQVSREYKEKNEVAPQCPTDQQVALIEHMLDDLQVSPPTS